MPAKPSFMIHTGDITHLSKVKEFDDADRIISQAKLDVHYVPGEHDFIDEEVKLYKGALRPRHQGRRLVLHSMPAACQFIGLGGRGRPRRPPRSAILGNEQLEWLEADLRGRSEIDADRAVRAYPAVDSLPAMGLGHRGRRPRTGVTSKASAQSPC